MPEKSKFVYDLEDVAGLIIIPAEGFPPPRTPRSLADRAIHAYRQMMLDQPHMLRLNSLASALRDKGRGFVPDFDPIDGGVNARLLFLMEKPGPMTAPDRKGKRGSGFVSRDNDDPTAEAVFNFMNDARIPREETLIWNVIPWWNGTTTVTASEWKEGLAGLDDLIDLLPYLEAVVLIGRKAARAKPILEKRRLPVWQSAHPSGRVRAAYPELFSHIPQIWAEAAAGAAR